MSCTNKYIQEKRAAFSLGVRGLFFRKLKKLGVFSAFFSLYVFSAPSFAVAQVTINYLADMDFGAVDFSTPYSGSVRLGTDGNVNVTGSGLVLSENGNAGQIQVDMPNTGTVEVKCANAGQLVGSGATSLSITNTEIALNTGVGFGLATACQGAGGGDPVALSLDMDSLVDPILLIGGEISIPGAITMPSDFQYTTTGTGTAIRLSLIVQ